jgi:hypothetical protein
MDGISLSASQAPCRTKWPYYGSIIKFTIASDRVTRTDTIYSYKEHWAGYPIINVQGTQCAFIRMDQRDMDTASVGNGQGFHMYLSVMDINGGNVRDLDTIPQVVDWMETRFLVAWPAGDYIYYHRNNHFVYGPEDWKSAGIPTGEIWKVKYNDPSTQSKIYTYRAVYTFGMSLDGTRAAITAMYGDMDVPGHIGQLQDQFKNLPHAFPPAIEPVKDGWDTKVWVGCGSYISPSGKYHWHFFEGGHANWRINTWNPPKELVATTDVTSGEFLAWAVDKSLTNQTLGGGPMSWVRWAANSDKWICGGSQLMNSANQEVGNNQILVNWIDHKLIVTRPNWQPSNAICNVRQNDVGALWVAGGPGGYSYEDVNGNWINVSPVSAGRSPVPAASGAITLSHKVNVYTVQGRLLGTWDRGTISRTLPSGAYFMAPVAGTRSGIVRTTVFGNEVR